MLRYVSFCCCPKSRGDSPLCHILLHPAFHRPAAPVVTGRPVRRNMAWSPVEYFLPLSRGALRLCSGNFTYFERFSDIAVGFIL